MLLRKRSVIETIIDRLKNISQVVHSHHRSPTHFAVNLTAGLIACTLLSKNPSIHLADKELALFPALI